MFWYFEHVFISVIIILVIKIWIYDSSYWTIFLIYICPGYDTKMHLDNLE